MNDFGRLLEAEIPRLRRYARTLTRDLGRADDLVQNCLTRDRPTASLAVWDQSAGLALTTGSLRSSACRLVLCARAYQPLERRAADRRRAAQRRLMPDGSAPEVVALMHGGTATFVQFVPVRGTFGGSTVWEGVVHVFDLY